MGPKGNVLIAKRGRDSYLRTCLHYLNKANSSNKYDIQITVIDDSDYLPNDTKLDHISVNYIQFKTGSRFFNKAKLLNVGLRKMRPDFDWVSVVDIDMVYAPSFFDSVCIDRPGCPYIISTGYKLDDISTAVVMTTHTSFEEILPLVTGEPFTNAPSQITLARSTINLLSRIFDSDKIFCEEFEGWGGEDSEMSFKARELAKHQLITKYHIPNMWYHLWHEDSRDETQFQKNLEIFEEKRVKNNTIIKRFRNSS
jgi:hypothetical protein